MLRSGKPKLTMKAESSEEVGWQIKQLAGCSRFDSQPEAG
jgi:hypothetical protein